MEELQPFFKGVSFTDLKSSFYFGIMTCFLIVFFVIDSEIRGQAQGCWKLQQSNYFPNEF